MRSHYCGPKNRDPQRAAEVDRRLPSPASATCRRQPALQFWRSNYISKRAPSRRISREVWKCVRVPATARADHSTPALSSSGSVKGDGATAHPPRRAARSKYAQRRNTMIIRFEPTTQDCYKPTAFADSRALNHLNHRLCITGSSLSRPVSCRARQRGLAVALL